MAERQIQKIIKKLFSPILYLLIGGFIFFEEYIWNKIFKDIYLKIKSLNVIANLKSYLLEEDCRYKLLFIFLIPFILMEGLSIIALKLISSGLVLIGLLIYLFKILLTIPVVIIFNSAKKKLLSFKIIYVVYFFIIKLKQSQIYLNIKKFSKKIKLELSMFKFNFARNNNWLEGFYLKIKNRLL